MIFIIRRHFLKIFVLKCVILLYICFTTLESRRSQGSHACCMQHAAWVPARLIAPIYIQILGFFFFKLGAPETIKKKS